MLKIKNIPYAHIKKLGAGAQGTVDLIKDMNTLQEYALKIYSDTVPEKSVEREIEILTEKSHPNILKVIDCGKIENNFYTITTYAPGGSLDMYIDEGNITLNNRIRILRDALLGLEFLHNENIIHRDIKPANIFIDNADTLKGFIGDFGLAKYRDDTLMEHSIMGKMMGTVAFLPPEYLRNETRTFDPKFDLYAIGVSLYKSITGYYPYGETEQELIENLNNDSFAPPLVRRYVPKIPKTLQEVCERALNPKKEERFKTARQFIMNLETVLNEHELNYSCPKPGEIKLSQPDKKIKLAKPKKTTRNYNAKEKAKNKSATPNRMLQGLLGLSAASVLLAGYAVYTSLQDTTQKSTKKRRIANPGVIKQIDNATPKDQKSLKKDQRIINNNEETSNHNTEKKKVIFKDEWEKFPNFHLMNLEQLDHNIFNMIKTDNKNLPEEYVKALYDHTFQLAQEHYRHNTKMVYAFDKAVKLKSMYTTLSLENIDEYNILNDTKTTIVEGNMRTVYRPQYTFLTHLHSQTFDSRQFIKIGKEMELFMRAGNAYFFINNVLTLMNHSHRSPFSDVYEEIKGDVYRYAGSAYLMKILDNNKLFYKYFTDLANPKNKHIKSFNFHDSGNYTHLGYTKEPLNEYIQLLKPIVAKQNHNDFLQAILELQNNSDRILQNFSNTNDFSIVEQYVAKYQNALNHCINPTEEAELYAELSSRLFKLSVIKQLYLKSNQHYNNIQNSNYSRQYNKKIHNYAVLLRCAKESEVEPIIDMINTSYSNNGKNRIYSISTLNFLQAYNHLRLKEDKLTPSLRRTIEDTVVQDIKKESSKASSFYSLEAWLGINFHQENYKYILSFCNKYASEITSFDSSPTAKQIYSLEILLETYNKLKIDVITKKFIEDYKLIQLCKENYSNNKGINYLGLLAEIIKPYSNSNLAENREILKEAKTIAIDHFAKRHNLRTASFLKQNMRENPVLVSSILMSYLISSYPDSMDDIRKEAKQNRLIHKGMLMYDPINYDTLYANLMKIHLTYYNSFRLRHQSYPQYLLEEFNTLSKDPQFIESKNKNKVISKRFNKLAARYQQLEKNYKK